MLAKYWLDKYWHLSLILIFSTLAVLSFGYPLYFDRLFIVVTIVLISVYKVNKNLFSIGLILLFVRGLDEIAFFCRLLSEAKLFYYLISAYIFYKFRFDSQTRNIIIPLFVICVITEFYWLFTDYPAPNLHTYIIVLVLNLCYRMLLINRVHLLRSIWGAKINGITLDYSLYKVTLLYAVIVIFMIIEYLIRHTTPLNPMYIYHSYSYLMGLTSILTIYFIIEFGTKLTFKFKA